MRSSHESAGTAPLLAWGESLRMAKARRAHLRRRGVIASAGIGVLLLSAVVSPVPRLVWNASASAPIGLYAVTPGASIEPGDTVVAHLPDRYGRLAAERHYLPINVPLVKRVAAYAGDDICAHGRAIFVNGRWMAVRRRVDARNRVMPVWEGCIRLRGRQLFLLMDDPASFDGRYFGVIEGRDVIGKARLLWRG